jgi:hypothetical protein
MVTLSYSSRAAAPQPGTLIRLAAQPASVTILAANDPSVCIEGRVIQSTDMYITVELPWEPTKLYDRMWTALEVGSIVTYERCMAGLSSLVQQLLSDLDPSTLCSTDIAGANAVSHAGNGNNGRGNAISSSSSSSSSSGGCGSAGLGGKTVLLHLLVGSWVLEQQDARLKEDGSSSASATGSSGRELLRQRLRCAGTEHVRQGVSEEVLSRVARGSLNSTQAAAVRAATAQRLFLLWGPPGTGKVCGLCLLQLIRSSLTAASPEQSAC